MIVQEERLLRGRRTLQGGDPLGAGSSRSILLGRIRPRDILASIEERHEGPGDVGRSYSSWAKESHRLDDVPSGGGTWQNGFRRKSGRHRHFQILSTPDDPGIMM